MRSFTARRVAPPAPLREEERILACDVSPTGEIGVLVTTEPGLARGFVTGPHGSRLPFYRPPRPCPAVLYRYREAEWHRVELAGLPVSYPMIALLPRDEVLVACPCTPWVDDHDEPVNAHVFDSTGAHLRTFAIGDDIEDLVVDDAGAIWATYGDQGVFGRYELSSIVRWDDHGNRLWDSGIACVDTAINVHAGTVWGARGASLMHVRLDGPTGRSPRSGLDATVEHDSPSLCVRALAFAEDRLLVVEPDLDATWCELGGGVQPLENARIVGPTGQVIDSVAALRSHGSHLYLNTDDGHWSCVDIAG